MANKAKSKKSAAQGRGALARRGDAHEPEMSQAELDKLLNQVGEMTFDEAAALAEQEGAPKIAGIQVVEKDQLLDVPFIIVHTKFREGDMGEYVSVTCKLQSGDVIVFNDGSTGVCAQLRGVDITPRRPMLVRGGLRVSRYTYTDKESGRETPAQTYYLNPNAPRRLGANGTTGGAMVRGMNATYGKTKTPRSTEEIE